MRVMIVDDATPVRQRVLAAFRKWKGVTAVDEAASGQEALALADKFRPDAVVLDLMLPDMTGIEVLQLLKAKYPDTVVAVFTNYSYPAFRNRCLELGASHFFGKSTEIQGVVATVLATAAVHPGTHEPEGQPL